MNLDINQLKVKQNLEDAQKSAWLAWDRFDRYQLGYKDALLSIFDKTALYSAGIISLSVTFLGYLLSLDSSVLLAGNVWHFIPIYYFLYGSWALLLVNLIISLVLRWADASYMFFQSQHDYHTKKLDLENQRVTFFQQYSNIVFSPSDTKETETATSKKNIETLNTILIPRTMRLSTAYLNISKYLQTTASVCFVVGIVCLLIFTIDTTYMLIAIRKG